MFLSRPVSRIARKPIPSVSLLPPTTRRLQQTRPFVSPHLSAATMTDAKLTLYTNHRCPWAHRVHIALAELGVPFEEVIISLDTPREPWYLEVNPRGLVPSLKYEAAGQPAEIIIESGIVAQFLADLYTGKGTALVLPSTAPGGALQRARIAFFVDAYFSKVQSQLFGLGKATTAAAQDAIADAVVAAVAKELEPLLAATAAKGPFFGGSSHLTLAEVQTGSFALRLLVFSTSDVYPSKLATELPKKAPAFWAWVKAVAAHPSVNGIFDEKLNVQIWKQRLEKQRAEASAN